MKTARDDGRRVEGHSDDRDRANRGGKFARARARWEGKSLAAAATRENRKFNLCVPPLNKNSLALLDTPSFTPVSNQIEIRMPSIRLGALVGNGFPDFNRLGDSYAS